MTIDECPVLSRHKYLSDDIRPESTHDCEKYIHWLERDCFENSSSSTATCTLSHMINIGQRSTSQMIQRYLGKAPVLALRRCISELQDMRIEGNNHEEIITRRRWVVLSQLVKNGLQRAVSGRIYAMGAG